MEPPEPYSLNRQTGVRLEGPKREVARKSAHDLRVKCEQG